MKYLKPSIIHCITFFSFINIVFAQAEAEYIEKEFNRWAGADSYSTVLNEDVYLQIRDFIFNITRFNRRIFFS